MIIDHVLLKDLFQLPLTLRFVRCRTLLWTLLRGAMSAVTGVYLFRLLQYIVIFCPAIFFFTLTNSVYPDEMRHDGISPVYK